MNDLRLTQQ